MLETTKDMVATLKSPASMLLKDPLPNPSLIVYTNASGENGSVISNRVLTLSLLSDTYKEKNVTFRVKIVTVIAAE
jgi:hypothetical protein